MFDNFAFDEVLQYGDLNTRTRLMVQLASMIASQALAEYRVVLGAALTVGVSPAEAKEVVYQAVPYVGMAKVFDFLHATNDVLTERGISSPWKAGRRRRPGTGWRRVWPSRRRRRRRRRRRDVRRGSTGRAPHPALPVGELLR